MIFFFSKICKLGLHSIPFIMSAYSVVDLSGIIKRSGAIAMPKRGGLAKMDLKGEEEIVALTGGIILDADGSLATLKPYIAWDPTKEHNGTTGNYVFINPPPFYDSTRTFDPTTDAPIMHPPYPCLLYTSPSPRDS